MGNRNDGYWYQGMGHAHDGWWGGPFHVIVLLLLLALVIAGAVWLIRRFAHTGLLAPTGVPSTAQSAAVSPDPAVAALRMRYATGKVSREEFQHALADLTGATPPWPGAVEDEDSPTTPA